MDVCDHVKYGRGTLPDHGNDGDFPTGCPIHEQADEQLSTVELSFDETIDAVCDGVIAQRNHHIDINTFDIDGVIFQKEGALGCRPNHNDIIITGRPQSEATQTLQMLRSRGIWNKVYFNPLERDFPEYGQEASGKHKARIIAQLILEGYNIQLHFEDDAVQATEIKNVHPNLRIILCTRFEEEIDTYAGVN